MLVRTAVALAVFAALSFGGLVGGLYAYQRDLIYLMPEIDRSVPDGFLPITYRTSDGLDLVAGYLPAKPGQPTLLFFHGNGVDWQTTYHTTELLAAYGYGVMAAEYRGYGGNPGSPDEQGLYRDGQAAFDWLLARGLAPEEIVLVGNSLGSGVATELARQHEVLALILISPFKSIAATASNAYPFVPVDRLLHDRFDNIAKIGEVVAPVLVVHGVEDRLIPLAHARELAAARPGTQFVALPGFGHNMSGEPQAQLPQLLFLQALASD